MGRDRKREEAMKRDSMHQRTRESKEGRGRDQERPTEKVGKKCVWGVG